MNKVVVEQFTQEKSIKRQRRLHTYMYRGKELFTSNSMIILNKTSAKLSNVSFGAIKNPLGLKSFVEKMYSKYLAPLGGTLWECT